MTLAKRVIPCLDVIAGRVMKGVAFVDLRDAGDPAELAARYDQDGADELVFLDITASSDGRAILLDAVQRTADRVFIPLTVGGGVRTMADIDVLLRAGADKVSINTAALDEPKLIEDAAQSIRSPVCRDRHRCETDRARATRSIPTAVAAPPVEPRWHGRGRPPSAAPARSCSRRWTATGPSMGTTWS